MSYRPARRGFTLSPVRRHEVCLTVSGPMSHRPPPSTSRQAEDIRAALHWLLAGEAREKALKAYREARDIDKFIFALDYFRRPAALYGYRNARYERLCRIRPSPEFLTECDISKGLLFDTAKKTFEELDVANGSIINIAGLIALKFNCHSLTPRVRLWTPEPIDMVWSEPIDMVWSEPIDMVWNEPIVMRWS